MNQSTRNHAIVRILLLAVPLWFGVSASLANPVTISYLQGKSPVAADAITTLGPDLFGDRVNLFNGSLEFEQTDTSLPGNNILPVALNRSHSAGRSGDIRGQLGDWDLDTPRIGGSFSNLKGWVTASGGTDRCTNLSLPPIVTSGGVGFIASDYHGGTYVHVAGQGAQEVLRRSGSYTTAPTDGNSYPNVTHKNWQVSCLPTVQNAPGEGFVAVSPDGVRYRFDWMATRWNTEVQISGGSIGRKDIYLMATLVTDRFGNWVQYSYDSANPMNLTSIVSSDGRAISLTYAAGRVSSVYDGTRTFTYGYTGGGNLAFVQQPDGSRWTFNLTPMVPANLVNIGEGATCDYPGDSSVITAPGNISHPSGAVGTFEMEYTVLGRSQVTRACKRALNSQTVTIGAVWPRYLLSYVLTSKQITGPGLPNLNWSYGYNAPGSWSTCTTCPDRRIVTVIEPTGSQTRHIFGNRWRVDEGQLLQVDEGWNGSVALRTTTHRYRRPAGQVYPEQFGTSLLGNVHSDWLASRHRPEDQRVVTQQDTEFKWDVDASPSGFDYLVRPVTVTKASQLNSRTENTQYSDHLGKWVLGQTKQVDAAGREVEWHQYDLNTTQRLATREFGRPTGSYEYNPVDGTLSTVYDPAGRPTILGNYKRGRPQVVTYPDGSSASQVLNNLGNADTRTNEAGFTTVYGYDAIGRLASINHPAEPTGGYHGTIISHEQVPYPDRGLAAGHWRQTTFTGNARSVRYFDAMWRERLRYQYDAGDETATARAVETRFDADGRKVFESYPQRSLGSVDAYRPGQAWARDPLDRVVAHTQESELGTLTTTTEYLSGFQKRVTNPRGQASTFSHQAFDQPTENTIAAIWAPEGVAVSIPRDMFGKATAITRSGGGASATRSYVYDSFQRLCKTVEPETGATIQAYDAAGNLAWRASGQAATGSGSCDQASVGDGNKINFGYDTRNRLTSTTYGDGSPGVSRTYTPDGLLQELRSSALNVSWTYRYNNRRLLVQELYTWYGQTAGSGWNFSWGRDTYGNVSALTDPWGTMTYAPNALGEATQVSGYATGIRYHPNGAVAGYRLDNGITHSMEQNLRGLPATAVDAGVTSEMLTYDANGNVTGIQDLQEGGANNRSMPWYDGLDRLRQANGPWGSATFAYDALDNLVASTVGGRVLNHYVEPSSQLLRSLTGSQTIGLDYDARGNLINRAGQAFVFDIGNRMASAPGKVSTYIYDGHGRRNWTSMPDGHWRLQTYTTDGKLRFGYATNPGQHTRYVYVGDKLIAETSESATTYSHTDMLGSPVAKTNSIGALLSRTRYEPYGATVAGSTNPTGIGYTGHVNDADTGLVYMQQRYYDPLAGRFLSVDPVTTDTKTGDHFNRYAYADNNPYKFIDPDGRNPVIAAIVRILLGVGGKEAAKAVGREGARDAAGAARAEGAAARSEGAQGTAGGDRAGKPFTPAGKEQVKSENATQNGGQTTCSNCGQATVPAKQSESGVAPPKNETQVDHKIPQSKGGDGSPSNGQVLCRDCNLKKSDK